MEAQLLDSEYAKIAYVEQHGPGNEQALTRLHTVCGHLIALPCSAEEAPGEQPSKPPARKGPRTITITDSETNKTITLTVEKGSIRASELRQIGLKSYDPGYLNTASARSSITYIDGMAGKLLYRGYRIEELAERSNFLEVAYLLIFGELPTKAQFLDWKKQVMEHTYVHSNLSELMHSFRYDAHPMGMLVSSVAAMGTFYPDANPALQGTDVMNSKQVVFKQIVRLIGKMPTIAAYAYRHRIGRPFNAPDSSLSYTENFLAMLDRLQEPSYRPNPRLARALDILFLLHADHEMNCSTSAMRHITSAMTDPYTAVAGAAGALYGPFHGGANEAVLRMLEAIGSVDNIPSFLQKVKQKKTRLMGFGHRVYKNYDPRATIIRSIAYEVFSIMGDEPLITVAVELEKQALADEYFVSHKLFPNVDFYSGLIYKAMGFPTDMFPVLFAIPRTAGWLAHWYEQLQDKETKIARPQQLYEGPPERDYVAPSRRDNAIPSEISVGRSNFSKRRSVAVGADFA